MTSTLLGIAGLLGALVVAAPAAGVSGSVEHWVASWVASPTDSATPVDAAGLPVPAVLADQTIRMIVVPHLDGTTLRLHLSNRFGTSLVTFGRVSVGTGGGDSGTSVRDLASVTFGGLRSVTVPAGQDAVSDPVAVTVRAFVPVAISVYLPDAGSAPTKHWNANATSIYAGPFSGDLTGVAGDAAFPLRTEAWFYVDGVDVLAPETTSAVVAFGDSITDGFVAATALSLPACLCVADRNRRYPDDLQRRLLAAGKPLSVVDAGFSSNRLLTDGEPLFLGPSGLQRLRADALDQAGASGVLLLEGINDLGLAPGATADQLIAGYEQAIATVHADGKKIWLGTIMPASNALFDGTLLSPLSETYREQVNSWIRTKHLSDGVVDFDLALRDPDRPTVLDPVYAGPDNLHPNLLGYQVMADAVHLVML